MVQKDCLAFHSHFVYTRLSRIKASRVFFCCQLNLQIANALQLKESDDMMMMMSPKRMYHECKLHY